MDEAGHLFSPRGIPLQEVLGCPLKGGQGTGGFVLFWCVELLQKAEGGTSPNHTPESHPRITPRIIPQNHTP